MSSYQRAVDTLYRLQWSGQKLGLETIRGVLDRIGNPQRTFRSIHIAGTNGKGSTTAAVARILQSQGRRVGLYTSPHLVDFSERIRIDGVPISHDAVAELTERISRLTSHVSPLTPTFFEFTTAMAFAYFAEHRAEFAVIETGLGGRFDATNVITPMVSVITNIDLDHQEYLGESLIQIAGEKAGIIKPGIPAVTGAVQEDVLDLFSRVARERQNPLYVLGKDFRTEGDSPERFDYVGMRRRWDSLSMSLMGRHQLRNAACALSACEVLAEQGVEISESSVREGLRSVRWEGRLEPIETPGGPLFLLDGAHNPAGARVLRDFLKPFMEKRGGRLVLILGIMRDKDIPGILDTLSPLADVMILTRPQYHRAAPTSQLSEHAYRAGLKPRVTETVEEAVRLAKTLADAADTVCVTGSLFTVGEVRAILKGLGIPSPLKG